MKVSPLIPRFLLGTTLVTSSCSVELEAEPRWGGDQLSAARRCSGCPADVQLGGEAAARVLVAAQGVYVTASCHPERKRKQSCAPPGNGGSGPGAARVAVAPNSSRGRGALHSCVLLPNSLLLLRRHEPAAGISEPCKADHTDSKTGQTWAVDVRL